MASNPNFVTSGHKFHTDNEPLPGARGGQATADYSTGTMERQPSSALQNEQVPAFDSGAATRQYSGHNAYNEERPLNVEPTDAGGVAIDGRSDLPEGHAKAMDKVVGKTQKVMGKMTHNAAMHEKGELRESGGKAAASGGARAPHD